LSVLWPDSDAALSGQSLNSLTYTVRKLLGKHLGGASPVIHSDGDYRLNIEAGIAVDIARFDAWAEAGDQQLRAGNRTEAAALYENAVGLYRGDLSVGSDVHSVLERERLRARYQSLLAQLADFSFAANDYVSCLRYSRQLLEHDPCREGAHRLMMRCYSRCGERAQALRQYRLCVEALHNEFDAQPEATTIALFDQIRFDRGNT
jgi:DNA-binding SARP family transcriptional activator